MVGKQHNVGHHPILFLAFPCFYGQTVVSSERSENWEMLESWKFSKKKILSQNEMGEMGHERKDIWNFTSISHYVIYWIYKHLSR